MTETAVCKWCKKPVRKIGEQWAHTRNGGFYINCTLNAEPSPAVPQAPKTQTDLERIEASYTFGGQSYQPIAAPAAQTVPIPDVPFPQHEREMMEVLKGRDDAEDALGEAYEAVVGESPEWSNLFGYADAINEIAEIHRNQKESRLRAEATIAELTEAGNEILMWFDAMDYSRLIGPTEFREAHARATGKES